MDRTSKGNLHFSKKEHPRRFIHLRTKLAAVFFSIMVVASMLIVLLVYNGGSQTIKASVTDTYLHGLQNAVALIDETLTNIESSMYPMIRDGMTSTRLRGYGDASDYERYMTDLYYLNFLKNIVLQNTYVESAYLYYPAEERLIGTGLSHTYTRWELENSGWLDRLSGLSSHIGGWGVCTPVDDGGREVVANVKWIRGSGDSRYGALIVNVSPELWSTVPARSSGGTDFSCICQDGAGNTILDDAAPGAGFQQDMAEKTAELAGTAGSFAYGEYMISYVESSYSGWSYFGVARSADLLRDLQSFRSVIVAAIALIIGFTTIVLIVITSHIMHPINVLNGAMQKVGAGDFFCNISEQRNDDFGMLYEGFNSMVVNLDASVKTIYRQKMEKKDLSMQILRSQLNAHFLYNTLDTIHWIAKINHDEVASELIMHLADYYRRTLNQGKDTMTIEDAVALANSYLAIWRIESDSAVRFRTEIPDGMMQHKILKSIIQPLLENSLQHGQGTRAEADFTITLSCTENPDHTMTVRIHDNGQGMPPQRLAEIRESLNGEIRLDGSFALKNIQAQIRTFYGSGYGLDVDSVDGAYTAVTITVPISE